ncbi:MAG: hypothetical protein WD834_00060 [Actinomycetota bacterium]
MLSGHGEQSNEGVRLGSACGIDRARRRCREMETGIGLMNGEHELRGVPDRWRLYAVTS